LGREEREGGTTATATPLPPSGSGDKGRASPVGTNKSREQWQCRMRATVVVVEWSCCFMLPTTTTWSRGKEQDGLISTIGVP